MNERKLEKFFQKISYRTYKNIGIITSVTPMVLPIIGIITRAQLITLPISITCLIYEFATIGRKYQNCTKEATQTKKLYIELLELYKKLLIELELNHPTELYTIHNYMCYNGYLSNGNKFEFGRSDAPEISSNLGINVVTGKAVCRNISAMLVDINRTMDINSQQLSVYSPSYEEQYDERQLRDAIQFYEEILKDEEDAEIKKAMEYLLNNFKNILANITSKKTKKL